MTKTVLLKNMFTSFYVSTNVLVNYWPQNIGYLTLSILTNNVRKKIEIIVNCHVKNELLAPRAEANSHKV